MFAAILCVVRILLLEVMGWGEKTKQLHLFLRHYDTLVRAMASVNLSEMEHSSWVCAVVTLGIPGMSQDGLPPAGAIVDLSECGQGGTLHTFYLIFNRRQEGPATWSSASSSCLL